MLTTMLIALLFCYLLLKYVRKTRRNAQKILTESKIENNMIIPETPYELSTSISEISLAQLGKRPRKRWKKLVHVKPSLSMLRRFLIEGVNWVRRFFVLTGRIHSAIVAGIDLAQGTAVVEWFEQNETKGKEINLAAIESLNPELMRPEASSVAEPARPEATIIESARPEAAAAESAFNHTSSKLQRVSNTQSIDVCSVVFLGQEC